MQHVRRARGVDECGRGMGGESTLGYGPPSKNRYFQKGTGLKIRGASLFPELVEHGSDIMIIRGLIKTALFILAMGALGGTLYTAQIALPLPNLRITWEQDEQLLVLGACVSCVLFLAHLHAFALCAGPVVGEDLARGPISCICDESHHEAHGIQR